MQENTVFLPWSSSPSTFSTKTYKPSIFQDFFNEDLAALK